jgi:hypothetical protein
MGGKGGIMEILEHILEFYLLCNIFNVLWMVHHSTVYRYSEMNMMHFLFCLLRITGLYMF